VPAQSLDDPLPSAGDDPLPIGRPSKTRLKQAMHELQDLGEALVGLPEERIAALALPESLLGALEEFRRTRSHEGRRRQMQYIGKLMRRIDPEPIREAVAAARLGQARDALSLHEAEGWRKRLIENDADVTAWGSAFPGSDVQQLRSLIRAARKDAAAAPEQRSGRAYRELFQFIKQAQAGRANVSEGA
jgi:ribosome-associated protein